MFSKRMFETDFTTALTEELARKGMTVRELADRTGIPASTLYKVTLGERDPRFSTVQKIVRILEPERNRFIAIIAAKFLLDSLDIREVPVSGGRCDIRGYSANSLEECIIAAVRAEKEGAAGIVCAPILASIVEKIVDVPVSMLRPDLLCVKEAVEVIARQIR